MPLKLLFLLRILTTTVSFSQNVGKGKIVDATRTTDNGTCFTGYDN